MKLLAFDMVAKRIATIDADPGGPDPGTDDDGVDVPNVGLAAGVAAVSGVGVPPGVGFSAGVATVTVDGGPDPSDVELEPLRIYPWEISVDNDYRPVHSQGLTVYTRASQVIISPESSNDFETIAELQAVSWASAAGFYRIGAIELCSTWAGRDWYSIGVDYDPVADDGPETPTEEDWTNDPAPPQNDPQRIIAWTAARELAAATVLVGLGEVWPATIPLGEHTVVDTVQSYAGSNPWSERYISHYQQQFVGRLPSASDVPSGYDLLATHGGYLGGDIWQYTWGSYMLRVTEERVPHHPLEENGKTWAIDTGVARQLAAIEYRDGFLYQNGIGPVLMLGHPLYDDDDWWEAQRISAIERGLMKPDVTSPIEVTTWARRVA